MATLASKATAHGQEPITGQALGAVAIYGQPASHRSYTVEAPRTGRPYMAAWPYMARELGLTKRPSRSAQGAGENKPAAPQVPKAGGMSQSPARPSTASGLNTTGGVTSVLGGRQLEPAAPSPRQEAGPWAQPSLQPPQASTPQVV